MNKFAQIFLLLFFFTSGILAQTKVKGVVLDLSNSPVPFANVIFKDTKIGSTTGMDGKFYLEAPEHHSSLIISYIGFKSQTVHLKNHSSLNLKIILEEKASALNTVMLFQGKTSKKNNPAIDILRKIWKNKRSNGVKTFSQYEFREYEKLEFEMNNANNSLQNLPVFKGMEFMFSYADTNRSKDKTYLPVFINESVSKVYGDNTLDKENKVLLGNKNSGFSENQKIIAFANDVYDKYNIYDNYLKIYKKSFVSPLSTTGIHNYNYVLTDSAYVDNKWCYNIFFYPRRKNELTFKGDFWVNDTTWAIKKINLEAAQSADINWVRDIYMEQEFEVLNDSVFVMTKDFFKADFSWNKKEGALGVFAKRTTLYDDYLFNQKKEESFYSKERYRFSKQVYNRGEGFWSENRLEALNKKELGIYTMLDSLTQVRSFNIMFGLAEIAESDFVKFKGWEYGPVSHSMGYNEVEGLRIRVGGRTYFNQNDPWKIGGYIAYGLQDEKFKYGILANLLLDYRYQMILYMGKSRDVKQLGASLTNLSPFDVFGGNLASASLFSVGKNNSLSAVDITSVTFGVEPVKNLTVQVGTSLQNIKPVSQGFSLDYYKDAEHSDIASEIDQFEISAAFTFIPGKKNVGFGVERKIQNPNKIPTFFLKYSKGVPNFFESDFNYDKIQMYYHQPILIGGFGLAKTSIEAGKIFGEVPLGLLSVIPGNQSYVTAFNTFSLLNYYEFVSDTYLSAHFEHNFNGRIMGRIPWIRQLDFREIIGVRGVWGQLAEANKSIDASGLPLKSPDEDPYWEYSVGIGNIFKLLRIDSHFRGNYLDDPGIRKVAVTGAISITF